MTLSELQADPSFDRHRNISRPVDPAWITVAVDLLRKTRPELAKLSQSQRESIAIGLEATDDYRARKALRILSELPPPKAIGRDD